VRTARGRWTAARPRPRRWHSSPYRRFSVGSLAPCPSSFEAPSVLVRSSRKCVARRLPRLSPYRLSPARPQACSSPVGSVKVGIDYSTFYSRFAARSSPSSTSSMNSSENEKSVVCRKMTTSSSQLGQVPSLNNAVPQSSQALNAIFSSLSLCCSNAILTPEKRL